MDEVEKIISRLNGINPARPYFDPLAVEEALGRHARQIGFRNVSFTWAMGPKQAAEVLADVDFETPEMRKWHLTMQALEDQARVELQQDETIWNTYRVAQKEAEARLGETLHLDLLDVSVMNLVDEDAAIHGHTMAYLVAAALRDMTASAFVENERLEDINEAYLPFVDAMLAGLGSFWVIEERFVCLPLPRLSLQDGKLVRDGSPAAVWPNGETYAVGDEGLVPALQSVEW